MSNFLLNILKFEISCNNSSINIVIEWYLILLVLVMLFFYFLFKKRIKSKLDNYFIDEQTFEISTPLLKYTSKIKRNYQNLFIANRIYIELVTRKAPLVIDKNKDVIKEVYDSWYILFKTIRDEIKSLPGEFLINNTTSKNLIDLTIKILNAGLRPHLTEYQAEFRKWYEQELKKDENMLKSPQEIQKNFPKFNELIDNMIEVSNILEIYKDQLKNFIDK